MGEHDILVTGAMVRFERMFPHVTQSLKHDKDVPLCWAGGLTDFGGTPPVLYPTAERAIKAWEETARSSVNIYHKLEWFQKPELQELQITIADKRGSHRLVDNKWTVKSQFAVYNDE